MPKARPKLGLCQLLKSQICPIPTGPQLRSSHCRNTLCFKDNDSHLQSPHGGGHLASPILPPQLCLYSYVVPDQCKIYLPSLAQEFWIYTALTGDKDTWSGIRISQNKTRKGKLGIRMMMLIQGSKTGLDSERNAAAEWETQGSWAPSLWNVRQVHSESKKYRFSISLWKYNKKISFMVLIIEEKLREQPTSFAGSSSVPPWILLFPQSDHFIPWLLSLRARQLAKWTSMLHIYICSLKAGAKGCSLRQLPSPHTHTMAAH